MKYKKLRRVDYIVVHCSATDESQDVGVEEITRWHRERNFFTIGYHYVLRRNGNLEHGRDHTIPGAHARGFNHRSLGVCLVGGIDENRKPTDNFTEDQRDSLEALLRYLKKQHPDAVIVGHRDLPRVNKACPSFEVREFCNARGVEHGQKDPEAESP